MSAGSTRRSAGMEVTLRLSVPAAGIRAGEIWLRVPQLEDVDGLLPAFNDPELRDAGNLPAFGRDEHRLCQRGTTRRQDAVLAPSRRMT